ncbi:PadR family transcriptional regulator [Microlunatus capsulatus]|uniref:PadR family transcriptional regulator PadR n=1 Tax=Microlunatus capsulatus TaxID=99117 RepID=A0ABS4ZDT8_9ACTN|nr:PadR family transcriptional regulator [Microlunatus capsulatus]MBP2418910.1 PadR family transcriptional regulator PadR [Microlunatus capsulatus]
MASVERSSLVLRGVLDLCLLALLTDRAVYGYELSERLGAFGLPVAPGSVYPLLARLERQGLVKTELRPSERGPARKYYALTAEGRRVLVEGHLEWESITAAVDRVLCQSPPSPNLGS